jgi:hypothetical protein
MYASCPISKADSKGSEVSESLVLRVTAAALLTPLMVDATVTADTQKERPRGGAETDIKPQD